MSSPRAAKSAASQPGKIIMLPIIEKFGIVVCRWSSVVGRWSIIFAETFVLSILASAICEAIVLPQISL